MLVSTTTAAAAGGSNGRFAGSSPAELEDWLVSEFSEIGWVQQLQQLPVCC